MNYQHRAMNNQHRAMNNLGAGGLS
jgi:hypothetical protein